MITGGTGSGDVNEAYTVSLVEGLKAAGVAADATLAERLRRLHRRPEEAKQPPRQPFMPRAAGARDDGVGRRDRPAARRSPTSAS